MLIYDEAVFGAVLWTHAEHYNAHRQHQSRNQRSPEHDDQVVVLLDAPVQHRRVLGRVSESSKPRVRLVAAFLERYRPSRCKRSESATPPRDIFGN